MLIKDIELSLFFGFPSPCFESKKNEWNHWNVVDPPRSDYFLLNLSFIVFISDYKKGLYLSTILPKNIEPHITALTEPHLVSYKPQCIYLTWCHVNPNVSENKYWKAIVSNNSFAIVHIFYGRFSKFSIVIIRPEYKRKHWRKYII